MEHINQMWVSRTLRRDENEEYAPSSRLSSIPSMLWAQVYHKLQPLVELNMGMGGCRVIRWSHKYFTEFAEARYLNHQAQAVYESLADYFSGKYVFSRGI